MVAAFAEFVGIPVPSAVVLLYAGALSLHGHVELLVCASLAALLADLLWFWIGRRSGERLLGLYCKISLGSEQCTVTTTQTFDRFGLPSLLVAKLIPGYSTFAAPMAGRAGTTMPRFISWDFAGAMIWAGLLIGAGAFIGRSRVDELSSAMEARSNELIAIAIAAVVLYLGFKLARRYFYGPARAQALLDKAKTKA